MCREKLIRWSDRDEGRTLDSEDICPHGCTHSTFAYGNYDDRIGEKSWAFSYRDGEEVCQTRYVEQIATRDELRDLMAANPIDPRWLTSTVLDLCKTIRDDHRWEVLPILADALMDAGCDNENILGHLRRTGNEHQNNYCWAVAFILRAAGDVWYASETKEAADKATLEKLVELDLTLP